MTATEPPKDNEPLLNLSPLVRELVAMVLVVLAAVHLAWPHSGMDLEFIGLLGFAVLILFLDIESVEWLGIRARRRQIAQAVAAVRASEAPAGVVSPATPPVPDEADLARSRASTTHPTGFKYSATIIRRSKEHDPLPPHDPAERLLWAHEQIRIEMLIIAGNAGRLPRRADWSSYLPGELIGPVRDTGLLAPELALGVREVVRSRNDAVHAKASQALVEPGGYLALEVLSKLRSIKRNYIRVRSPDVPLYADKNLREQRPQKGVILAQVDTDGRLLNVDAFPRLLDYAAGRFVSWEWDRDYAVEGQTWYQDPGTTQVVSAFSKSLSFTGREYPEEWRLDLRLPNPDAGLP